MLSHSVIVQCAKDVISEPCEQSTRRHEYVLAVLLEDVSVNRVECALYISIAANKIGQVRRANASIRISAD